MSFDLKISGGDLVIKNNQLQTVIDSEKLIQDILKICLTEAGSNPYQPWYGSFLSRSIVGSALDTDILVQVGKSQLNTALDNLRNLQTAQVQSFQKVSSDEQFSSTVVSIIRNKIDPRLFDVRINVITKGQKPITTAFRVSTI